MWSQQRGSEGKKRGEVGQDLEHGRPGVSSGFAAGEGIGQAYSEPAESAVVAVENASEASIFEGLVQGFGEEVAAMQHDGSFQASGLGGLGFPALRRNLGRLRAALQGPVPNFKIYLSFVEDKEGIEIGGPSGVFRSGQALPIYPEIGRLDNCNFSARLVGGESGSVYKYATGKPAGLTYFCDGSDLREIRDGSYDAVLSAHNLVCFANPVKALKEWQRLLRPGGVLALVLPHYEDTFDHRRTPTTLEHMLNDYASEVGEDDQTHLGEIFEKHDLSRDKAAGPVEEFRDRVMESLRMRRLHHHVFDETNAVELLEAVGFDVLAVDRAKPNHLCLLGRY